ncbi:hypothetical protein PAXRUDRAFT_175586, partial [Paxillus rubicundulus Ve08.2h10]
KKKGEGLNAREVKGTVEFGEGSLMVWGCIGWNGVGVSSEVEHISVTLCNTIFQQDNNSKHTSRRAQS